MTPVQLSDSAAKRIKELAIKEGRLQAKLRLRVDGGGCSGFQYHYELVESEPEASDLVVENQGAFLLVDETSQGFLEGAIVDYVVQLIGAHFEIRNPNAKASCGCGNSFSPF
ncbi:MAG: iron-sulfur cluster assembly accessory protein [Alphaproteobacteria bacterium]|nr:iron-sulfur cluster assembly accessory protein [Alphaproteobacteria bacterium]